MRTFLKIFLVLILSSNVFGAINPEVDFDNAFSVSALDISEDGKYIYAAVSDGTIRVLSAESGIPERAILFNKQITNFKLTTTGLYVYTDRLYHVLDNEKKEIPLQQGVQSQIKFIFFDKDGGMAVGLGGKKIFIISLTTGKVLFQLIALDEQYAAAFNPLERTVVTGGKDGEIHFYSLENGKEIKKRNAGVGVIRTLSYANGRIIAGGARGASLLTDDNIYPLSRHTDDVLVSAITPSGVYSVTGGDDSIPIIWNLNVLTGSNILPEIVLPVKAVAIDPYFRYIVYAGTASGDSGGVVNIQYTDNKGDNRRIFFYRDGSLVLDKVGHVAGMGLFGKYINYKEDGKTYNFQQVADIVNKPEKLKKILLQKDLSGKISPIIKTEIIIDSTPPHIALDSRGLEEIAEDDIISVKGTITDESGVEWAKIDGKPLILKDNKFNFEVAKNVGKTVTISASDVFGNVATKSFRIQPADIAKNEKIKNNGQKVALVIGINSYKYLAGLKTPEYDARTVAEILNKKYGYKVTMFLGKSATRTVIMSEINALVKTLRPEDKLIIYYAGHGYHNKKNGNAYWQLYDAKEDEDTEWLLTSQLNSHLASIQAREILIISDSCYSGVFSEKNQKNEKSGESEISRILLSSGGDEPVSDNGKDGHSVFTGALIIALNSNFSDTKALFDYISKSVKGQTPQKIHLTGVIEYIL